MIRYIRSIVAGALIGAGLFGAAGAATAAPSDSMKPPTVTQSGGQISDDDVRSANKVALTESTALAATAATVSSGGAVPPSTNCYSCSVH